MIERIKRNILPTIIALAALSVSASAAFYSVSGLSKLFAGAALEVTIMAASLEVAKLVIASLLYQYWDTLNKYLRTYLSIAAVVLVLITSMGIYGFLSAAYQETANKAGNIDAQVALVSVKRDNIKEQLTTFNSEKESTNKAIADLRSGLSSNKIQYVDKDGNVITTTSSATRKALEKQLDQAVERQGEINNKVDKLNEQLFSYETEIVEIITNSELAGELGPLKYLSGLTGAPMDKIINILLLIIIFVFDPLAISLVIAANFAFDRARPKRNLYGEVEDNFYDDDYDYYTTTEESSVVEDIKDIEVKDAEEFKTNQEFIKALDRIEKDWKVVNEDDSEIKEKKVVRVLQKTPGKRRVQFDDGTEGWVNRGDEDKIVYL
jgi:hypothetical protein